MRKLYKLSLIAVVVFLSTSAYAVDPPTNLTSGTITYSTVALSWTAPMTGTDNYRVVFKPGATAPTTITDGGFRDVGNITNYTVTGLPTGRQYSFAVFASNGGTYSMTAVTITKSTSVYPDETFVNEQAASYILGQSSMEAEGLANEGGLAGNTLFAPEGVYIMDLPASPFVDGNIIVCDTKNNRVLIYNSITTPTIDKVTPVLVLGQANMTSNGTGNGSSQMNEPVGAVVYNGTKLIVADRANHRVLIWNTFPMMNGQAADVVLGQAAFGAGAANRGGMPAANTLYSPQGVAVYGTKLIVADYDNHRVLIWNTIPTMNGQAADVVLGQANFTSNTAPGMDASTMATLKYPTGVAVSSTGKLVVSSEFEHRVLIWNTIPTMNNTAADIRLGQGSNNTNQYSGVTSATRIGYPKGVSISSYVSDKLAVSESAGRIMVWNTFPTTNNQAADVVLGMPNLTATNSSVFSNNNKAGASYNASRISNPYGICWTPAGNLYITDKNRNAVQRFDSGDQPLIGPTTLTVTSTTDKTASLSWSGGNAKKFRLVINIGSYTSTDSTDLIDNKYMVIDNLTGSSATLSNLECNTAYSIRIYGKRGVRLSTYPAYTGNRAYTTAGMACKNLPMADGYVTTMDVYGNILYIGGSFTSVGNTPRNGLAAIDLTTMQVTSWDPGLTRAGFAPPQSIAYVLKVSPDGQYVYVGGSFDKVGANTAVSLAKIDAATGMSMTYPQTNDPLFGAVEGMAVSPDGNVFIYGPFNKVGAENVDALAGIDPMGNVLTNFKPLRSGDDSKLRSIAVSSDGKMLYLGNGNAGLTYYDPMGNPYPRQGLVEIDIVSATPTNFDPYPDSRGVFGIVHKAKTLWISGSFDAVGGFMGTPRRRLAKFTCTTCDGTDWTLDATFAPTDKTNAPNGKQSLGDGGATIRDIWLDGTTLYMRGDLTNYAGIPRYGLAAVNANTASLITSFNTGVAQLDASVRVKLVGSPTLKKLFGSNGQSGGAYGFLTRKPVVGYFVGDYASTPVVASVDKIVTTSIMNMTYDFGALTAVDIMFPANTVNTDGRVTVERYSNKAVNVVGIDPTQIYQSTYGFVIHRPDPGKPDFTTAEVRFDLDELGGGRGGILPGQENTVKIYKRSTPGYGTFKDCGTVTYDNMTHELKVSVTSFSEFIFTSTDAVLPVELTGFKAIVIDNKLVQLNWATANEINASHFVVERSKDGSSFEAVSELNALGNSSNGYSYTLQDEHPYQGVSYYRLVQVDKDGVKRYFDMVSVSLTGVLTDADFVAYPNPSTGKHVQLALYQLAGQQVQVKVVDLMKGAELYNVTLSVQQDQASIALPGLSLPSGIYLVKLIDAQGKVKAKKLVVQ